MEPNHFLRGHIVELGHVFKVRSVVAAIKHGHTDLPGGRDFRRLQAVYDLIQFFIQPGVADDLRPVMDRHGAIGGDKLRDSLDVGRFRSHGKGADLSVDLLRDCVPEFNAQRAIGGSQDLCHSFLRIL